MEDLKMTREKINAILELCKTKGFVTTKDFEDVFELMFLDAKRKVISFEKMGYIKKDTYTPKYGNIFVLGAKVPNQETLNSLLEVETIDLTC